MEQDNKPNPVGRPKKIESPEMLWKHFRKYKAWAKDNPRVKQDFVGKDADEVERKLERPLSWAGFEEYLFERQVINDLGDYEKNKDDRYAEFAPIIRAIKRVIEVDQFEGATVGIFKENIIARKLGMVEKQETRQVDRNGNDVDLAPSKIILVQRRAGEDLEAEELDIAESEE